MHNFETYEPTLEEEQPTKSPNKWIGTFFLILAFSFLAGILGYFIAIYPLADTPQDCNASNITSAEIGFEFGVRQTINFIFETGTIPYFTNESGVEEMKYLDLNKMEDINNE